MSTAQWTRGPLTGLCAVLFLALALCTGAGVAAAAPGTSGINGVGPIIDGNGDDLIAFASSVSGTSCAINLFDGRDDVVIADPEIIVCGTLEDTSSPPDGVTDYFINGFDLRRFVVVYDRPSRNLYMLLRMEGFVGDVDGNGTPDNNMCPPTIPSFGDQAGIGSQENYQVRIDLDCDGIPEILIQIGGVGTDQIAVYGSTTGAISLAYRAGAGTGKDLEILVSDISLPDVFQASANANASFDGLGEDITPVATCGAPNPSIDLTKSVNVPVICPGGSADFTMVVTNTGNVDLANVTLVDNLPAGLTYTSTVSNTCGGAVNAVGNQITYGPFSLAVGASCTIVLRVGRTAECVGEQTNNATVEGSYTSACINGGEAIIVSDTASASVLCGNLECSIDAPDTRVCPGETVEICGPAGDFSYLWNTGATIRCLTVGSGTYSLTITDNASGCVSTNPCQVTIIEDPRPVCEIDAPDRSVCAGQTVQVCGPEGDFSYLWNTGATTRCINVGPGSYSLVITSLVTGCSSNNTCTVVIAEDTPQIEVTKSVSPEGWVEQGGLLTYTIVVTNPSQLGIAVDNVVVTDVLCDEALYAGNASPAPTSEPAMGANGSVVWNVAGIIAAGDSRTFTFQARVRELAPPDCESDSRSCTNRVSVEARCGEGRASDTDEVTTPIPPCGEPGLCRLTGGGCLNEDGDNRGRKQSTFGGNSSPFHEGGGPTGNSWEHVLRDGKTILFNWHSWDAYVTQCSVVDPGPCHPQAENTRADFQGTGKYSLGAGSREEDGNMVAYIIDHKEGACNRNDRDEYSITVRTGLVIGQGDIVFQTGGEIDCGNLQIHETPKWLFSGGTQQPGTVNEIESAESIALLNRAVPNPFTGSMSYAFEVTGADQPVDVGVYNVAGRLVKSLVKSTLPAGRHTASWNGTDEGGAKVPSGVYFVRARYGAELQQQRVIYLGR